VQRVAGVTTQERIGGAGGVNVRQILPGWRSRVYLIKVTMPILQQQRWDPGKEVGTQEGTRRPSAGSVGPIS
jgi:hypothetical protein